MPYRLIIMKWSTKIYSIDSCQSWYETHVETDHFHVSPINFDIQNKTNMNMHMSIIYMYTVILYPGPLHLQDIWSGVTKQSTAETMDSPGSVSPGQSPPSSTSPSSSAWHRSSCGGGKTLHTRVSRRGSQSLADSRTPHWGQSGPRIQSEWRLNWMMVGENSITCTLYICVQASVNSCVVQNLELSTLRPCLQGDVFSQKCSLFTRTVYTWKTKTRT